jgi:parallel beta-helix repeat protein
VFAGMKTNALELNTPGLVLIEGNIVDGTFGGHGIQLSGGGSQDFNQTMAHSHILRNNVFRNGGAGTSGIYLDNTPPDNDTIENNLMENNAIGGIFLHGAHNVTIRNNLFRRTGGTQIRGFTFQGGYRYQNINVRCNTIVGHNDSGVWFTSGATFTGGLTVTDNTFTSDNPWGLFSPASLSAVTSARNAYSGAGGTATGIDAGVGAPTGCGLVGPA